MPRTSRQSDADVANSLVRKRVKLRNRMLTFGEWMEGWGVQVDKEEEDDLIYQIVVFHDDQYVRTYTVNHKEFEVILQPDNYDQSAAAKFKGTECIILEPHSSIPETRLMKMMKGRPYRGGCEDGKQIVSTKGITNMKDVRIQYWDTTQATWYAGKILGMWKERARTHWLVYFDDGTEYAVSRTEDVWKLDQGETLIEGSAGTVTLAQSGDRDKKQLEFIVETTAPMHRLHVTSWKHGVQVFQSGKCVADGAVLSGTKAAHKRRRIAAEPACASSIASVEAPTAATVAASSNYDRAAIPGSRLWILSSHSPLIPGAMNVVHTSGVLKVTVPVE